MNVEFSGQDYFLWQTKISYSNSIGLKIIDEIEGNINLTIRQIKDDNDSNSYTRYLVKDLHNAEVIIANADASKFTSTEKPILLGTYKNEYSLLLEYVLEPIMSNTQSVLRLKFSIKKK